jgi:glycosyltransferase involved in cell wall biosynthesis
VNVDFYEPPEPQRAGGLDLAIRTLEEYLRRAGVSVRFNPPVEDLGHTLPDVLHFHGLWQSTFLRVSGFCRRRRIPYVVSPHGMLEPWAFRHKRWKKTPWYYLFEHGHLAGASALLATSEMEARNLANLFPSQDCRALPLGLTSDCGPGYESARRKLGWDESEFVLLFLSRIHPKKGLHLLLGALAGLEPDYLRNVRLAIVGGGEKRYVRELENFVRQDSSRLPRVDWVGEVWGDDRWAYFQGADLFCLPSYSENFGFAILEALQVGTRVLTTNQTPWDIMPSLGAGTVVEADEHAIRLALARFVSCPGWTDAERSSLASKIHAQFSWSRVGPSYLRFYEEILAGAREMTSG